MQGVSVQGTLLFASFGGLLTAAIGSTIGAATSAGPLKGGLVGAAVGATAVVVAMTSSIYVKQNWLNYLAGGVAAAAVGVYVAGQIESHPMSEEERKIGRAVGYASLIRGMLR